MFQGTLDEFVLNVLLMPEGEALSNDHTVLGVDVQGLSGGSLPMLQLHPDPFVQLE